MRKLLGYWALRTISNRPGEYLTLMVALIFTITWPAVDLHHLARIQSALDEWIIRSPDLILTIQSPSQSGIGITDEMPGRILSIPGVTSVSPIRVPLDSSTRAIAVGVHEPNEVPAIAFEVQQMAGTGFRIDTKDDIARRLTELFRPFARRTLSEWIPVMMSLVFLVLASFRITIRDRQTMGLLRCLGWTTHEIIELVLLQTGIVFSVACLIATFGSAFMAAGALRFLPLTMLLTGLPFLTASVLPILMDSETDPDDWLTGFRR